VKHISKSEKKVLKDFARLLRRLKLIERQYNPNDENLHVENFAYGDADLYPSLLSLAADGLKEGKGARVTYK